LINGGTQMIINKNVLLLIFLIFIIFSFYGQDYKNNDVDSAADEAFADAIKMMDKDIVFVLEEILEKHGLKMEDFKFEKIQIENHEITISMSYMGEEDFNSCEIELFEESDRLIEKSFIKLAY
jgi:hypothetical protein